MAHLSPHEREFVVIIIIISCAGCRHNMPLPPVTLTFDFLTLKVVSESRVTWATSVNFSLPRPLCSRLRPDVRDRQTDVRCTSLLNAPYPRGGGIIRHFIPHKVANAANVHLIDCSERNILSFSLKMFSECKSVGKLVMDQSLGITHAVCLLPGTSAKRFRVLFEPNLYDVLPRDTSALQG